MDEFENIDEAAEEIPAELVITVTPFTIGTKMFSELRLSEPTSGQYAIAQKEGKGSTGAEAGNAILRKLISLVGGWPMQAVDLLPIRKQVEAQNYLGRFLFG
jgi:hypothetical protein